MLGRDRLLSNELFTHVCEDWGREGGGRMIFLDPCLHRLLRDETLRRVETHLTNGNGHLLRSSVIIIFLIRSIGAAFSKRKIML